MKRRIRCYWFTFVVAKYYILFAVLPRLSGYSDVGCHKLQPTCRPAVSVGRQCVPAFSVGLAAVIALGIELSARLGPGATVILPVRRYASAGTSYGPASVCLCVCPSVTSRCSVETDERIELGFCTGASIHLSYTVVKVIRLSPKLRVLFSGTQTQTPDLENFATAHRSSKRVIDQARLIWTL